ncbi:DUF1661 domain-containing protein [Porphyromonas gingivalis]|nr:DUF1661 domain-containing protein [Porphyromonas gingivalis]ATR98243.1 DUF1661 domain-containing protein [Porphyromonas gingivalis]ATS07714.1 DUF1661 domain-containing protein [Porphyromonas gingivalis]PDP73644.1 DUF1661 domain-containing protein [Porphyromonas gingivalis]
MFVLVREAKNSRSKTKKFSRHIFRKHAPQSDRFWFVFRQPAGCRHSSVGAMVWHQCLQNGCRLSHSNPP